MPGASLKTDSQIAAGVSMVSADTLTHEGSIDGSWGFNTRARSLLCEMSSDSTFCTPSSTFCCTKFDLLISKGGMSFDLSSSEKVEAGSTFGAVKGVSGSTFLG